MPDMDPYERLGIPCGSSIEEVRAAYRIQVKKCHPDLITDPVERKAAQEATVLLNLAYEEALEISSHNSETSQLLSLEDAKAAAQRQIHLKQYNHALSQLNRADRKDAEWFYLAGNIHMQLKQYEKAHSAYREAVHRDPDNNSYREGALQADVAIRKSQSLWGRFIGLFTKS